MPTQTTGATDSALAEPVISVDGLSVRFHKSRRNRSVRDLLFKGQSGVRAGEFWALRRVTFDVQHGEAIGVIGRNGQGKSTLLKALAGVLMPDDGTVEVRGGVAPLIEITGGFVGDLTVRDNITLTAGLHGMNKEQVAGCFDDIVEFAEIENFLDAPYKHLSSGMRVRVAFAVVSRLEEPILLVDEVLAVGDRAFREKCWERIEELIDDGRTLFLVSHNARDLKRFCSRGLYMHEGKLIMDAPIAEVLEQYHADSDEAAELRREQVSKRKEDRERAIADDPSTVGESNDGTSSRETRNKDKKAERPRRVDDDDDDYDTY
ncbi:MAG: ABC transporter ATP-binding protein [Nocardioidaceae bacterium]